MKSDLKDPLVKRILSGLWGALSQKKISNDQITIEDNKVNIKIKKGHIIDEIKKIDDEIIDIQTYKPSLFYSSFARIKPFLLSLQKKIMYDNVIKPTIELGCNIIKVMNDSIIVDKRIKEYDDNTNLKVEKYDHNTIGKMIFEKEYKNFKLINQTKILLIT